MVKEVKKALVPKLRFPEFQDEAGWANHKLSDLTEVVRGGSPRPIDAFITTEPDGLNWLKIGDVPKNSKYITSTEQKILKTALSKTREVAPGDFILSNSMSFGRPYLSKIRTCIHDGWIAVTSVPDSFSRDFLYYSMMSEASQRYFENQAAGGGVRNLNVDIVKLLPVGEPRPAEQQKIADCLSSLDELIVAQGRKVEALKTYKRGLMQQLFPREGETLPRLRFREFVSAGSWHTQKIANLLSKASVSVSVEPDQTYREIGIRSHGKGIFHKAPILGKVIGEKRVFQVVQDALVLNIVFAWEQAVATTTKNEIGMIASHRFPMYVAKPGKCDVEYVKGFFLTKEGKRLLGVASPGGAGRNKTLGQKEFENLEIALPVSVDEQTSVANCLSALESKIEIESDKLELLNAHKRGLMQQLFPSLEEK